jgi:glycosyltransferase involved in cell wall biosynthesis
MPQISVVITTFNRENVIGRAIKSVINQSFEDYELIIIDDGSEDDTEEVVRRFNDKRIKYIKSKTNEGQNPSLNRGVNHASGGYIAFLDSDDEWLPEYLNKSIIAFNNNPSVGAVYSKAGSYAPDGEFHEGFQFQLEGDIYKEALAQGYLAYMITIVVKKEIIDLLLPQPFDPSFVYGQDDDFCFRVAKICRIALVSEPLAIIHNDGDHQGGEQSISKRYDLIAEGQHQLLSKYEDDILQYCGSEVLARKYLSVGKGYLRAGKLEKARPLFYSSYKIKKSLLPIIWIIYSSNTIIMNFTTKVLNSFRKLRS